MTTGARHAALQEHIRRIVDAAPPLSTAKRIRLAVLLRPDMPVGIKPASSKKRAT